MPLTVHRTDGLPIPEPKVVSEATDPELAARIKEALESHGRNTAWLSAHWDDLMPQARGRYVAVANQTAHLAESVAEARAWIDSQPRDPGTIIEFVPLHERPRINANRR